MTKPSPPEENRVPLSTEDQALLEATKEQLQERVRAFSFDIKRAKKRLDNGEDWQKLLQAHLYYDHAITQIDDKSLRDLANCTPKPLRELLVEGEREPGPLRFDEIVVGLLLMIEVSRQQAALQRLERRRSVLRLRSALDHWYEAIAETR